MTAATDYTLAELCIVAASQSFADEGEALQEKTVSFFQLSLCLFRACLGKTIFLYRNG